MGNLSQVKTPEIMKYFKIPILYISVGRYVIPCDFLPKLIFLLYLIGTGVLFTKIMGFKLSMPKSPIWTPIFKN